jgi:hypothetical protein
VPVHNVEVDHFDVGPFHDGQLVGQPRKISGQYRGIDLNYSGFR